MSLENIKLFKVLGEETRFKIIEVLVSGEKCACDISRLIERSQPNTSMQLLKLKDLDIIKSRRDGKQIIYSIKNNKILEIFKFLNKDK